MAKLSSDMKQLALCSFVEAAVVNTLLAAQNSLTCLLMLVNSFPGSFFFFFLAFCFFDLSVRFFCPRLQISLRALRF